MKTIPAKRTFIDDKKTMISFRMPTKLHKALKKQADQRGVTLTHLMLSILDDAAVDLESTRVKSKR